MLEDTPLAEMAINYENWMKLADIYNNRLPVYGEEPQLFPNHPPNTPYCIKYIFSDSIILIALDDDIESCLKLLTYTWRLIQVFLAQKVSLRGGIVHGEIYINPITNVCLGRGLTAAYELEQKQNWVGVAVDNSIWTAYPSFLKAPLEGLCDLLFPEYRLPMKSGTKNKMRVLNWRYNFICEFGTRSLFKRTEDLLAQEKINNTLAFAESIIKSKHVYHADQGKCPVEVRAFLVGETEPPFRHGDEL